MMPRVDCGFAEPSGILGFELIHLTGGAVLYFCIGRFGGVFVAWRTRGPNAHAPVAQ